MEGIIYKIADKDDQNRKNGYGNIEEAKMTYLKKQKQRIYVCGWM